MSSRWTLLALCVLAVGCTQQSGPPRVHLKGTVAYQGKPLEVGTIRITPLPGTEVPMTIIEFKDGKYDSHSDGGTGVPIGKHRVEINAYTAAEYAKRSGGGPFDPPPTNLLPAKFNENSTLELDLSSPPGPEMDHPFELK